jgi:hypothetical protein
MIEIKKIISAASGAIGKIFIPPVKDAAILSGWIGGIILIAFLGWFLTQPLRYRLLQRAVNRVLLQSGDIRRLGDVIPSGGPLKTGTYFTVIDTPFWRSSPGNRNASDATTAFVFTFIGDGFFFPCAALLSPEGKVLEFMPLSNHGERILKRLSPGVLKLYARRIEGSGS